MKYFSIALFILLSLCIYQDGQSQTVTEEWVARYNGQENGNEYVTDMALDVLGNVYITGRSVNSGAINYYVTIKYNTNGVEQWVAKYNGPGNGRNEANALAVDEFGNVYVTGLSKGNGTSDDFATIKYNTDGVELWVARYNGPGNGNDGATAIALDDFRNVFVTGYSAEIGESEDYVTIKYSSFGEQQWIARYNGPGWDIPTAIALDDLGNAYITGESLGYMTNEDYLTIKYNSIGVEQWVASYNGPGFGRDLPHDIVIDNFGNVYVTGSSPGFGSSTDFATVKYNSNGIEQWVARYNGPRNSQDIAYSMVLDGTGNIYVTGAGSESSSNTTDILTIKYNSSGIQQWKAVYDGLGNNIDAAMDITIDGNGNLYITGYSFGIETGNDYVTIKYNPDGIEQWVMRYNGPGNDDEAASNIALDNFGNVFVSGNGFGIGTGRDYITIKYSQIISVQQISNKIPSSFSLYQNSPNPFNPVTNIGFDIRKHGLVTLKVYDILGKEVATLVNESLNPGTYNYQLTIDNYQLTSGVYFYRLEADGFSDVKRMVLMK